MKNQDQMYNNEFEKLNLAKDLKNVEQKVPHQIANDHGEKLKGMALSKRALMAGSEISLSMIDFNEGQGDKIDDIIDDAVDRDEVATSMVKVEVIDGEKSDVKKQGRADGVSNLHYRRTMYDVAFAISITDEILNLEPLEDKLCLLRKKQLKTPYEVIDSLKARISLFSLYNLFDTVEHNHIDNQTTM